MATYPPKLELPYRVSRAWLEERTLAGDVVAPIHNLDIATDELSPDHRDRVATLAKRISTSGFIFGTPTTVEVVGSGITPWQQGTDESGRTIRATDPVTNRIDELPELPEPIHAGESLIEAYEIWLDRYEDLSLGALAAWIDRWAVDGEADDEGNAPNGLPLSWWMRSLSYRVGDRSHSLTIDGRKHLELFHRLVAASQLEAHAKLVTSNEDLEVALDIVGGSLQLSANPSAPDDVVSAYAEYIYRLASLAFARAWTRQRQREGFDLEMRRWAIESGSDRLQIGLSDDYRMVPVYLQERISAEMPGFYAHFPKKDDKHTWQPRTGPSEAALRLRRAVQDRLEQHSPPGTVPPLAEIGWIKKPPAAMCDRRHAYEADDFSDSSPEIKSSAFEIIAVRNWLGRYTLMAGVYTDAEDQPPDYLLLKYVLNPEDFGLQDLPIPPNGDSLAENKARATRSMRADDDIPF